MFCPEGFITLFEIWQEFGSAGMDYAISTRSAHSPPIEADKLHIDTGSDFDLKASAYQEWLFQNFLFEYSGDFKGLSSIYAFFPPSNILRLNSNILYASRVYGGLFPDNARSYAGLIEQVSNRLLWIEQETFTIHTGKTNPDDLDPNFGETHFFKNLCHLNGWIVCWKPPAWPYNLSELVAKCASLLSAKSEETWKPRRISRGRPPKSDGLIIQAVQNEYSHRLKKGLLPKGQREATTAEAIEWARRIFQEEVSRSAMQRYLAPVFEAQDAQK